MFIMFLLFALAIAFVIFASDVFVYLIQCKREKILLSSVSKIHKGQTKDEVVSLLGEEYKSHYEGTKLVLLWESDKDDIKRSLMVKFYNNQVIEITANNLTNDL